MQIESIDSFCTERLIAERLGPEHFDELCRLHSDPKVMKTLSVDGNTLPDDETRKSLERMIEHWGQNGFGLWAFRGRDAGHFIGRGGLQKYPLEEGEEIGLAYAVMSDLWGHGYATEMAHVSLQVGFTELCLSSIASWALPSNRPSQRVLEKVGFKHERDFVFAGLPHLFYRVRRGEYFSREAGRPYTLNAVSHAADPGVRQCRHCAG